MIKKIILLTSFLFLLFSCGTREDETDNEQYIGVWIGFLQMEELVTSTKPQRTQESTEH